MALLLLLMLLTACAAIPQDLSGKMFNFPEETNTAHVELFPSRQDFSAASVCLRFFTGLSRAYILFSMATESAADEFTIFVDSSKNFYIIIKDKFVFERHDSKLNTWHSVCSRWDNVSGVAELWFDGQLSNSTLISHGSIKGPFKVVVGQDQDSYGGGFYISQSFVGNMSDVHMWDYALSPFEIRGYMNHTDFTSGNVLNWRALKFQINGNVKIQSSFYNLNLSGKMFNFPEETNTAHVELFPSRQDFSAASVCLRFFTDLSRAYSLFSMASKSADNEFAIFVKAPKTFSILIKNNKAEFEKHNIKLNTWHSVCSTWDSDSGLLELWFDEQPSNSTFVSHGSINRPVMIVVGQDQDSYGGGFDSRESFVGNMSDVHMWDYALSPFEIRGYMNHQVLPPGDVLNWRALKFQINGNVKIQSSIYNPNLSGKMFNFLEETDTSYVKLIPSRQDFSAASVCLRFFTGLSRDYSLFSMASGSFDNDLLLYRTASSEKISVSLKNNDVYFGRQDVKLNTWHSICSTWDPDFDLAEFWFDGMPSNRRSVKFGSINGPFITLLGQEQDSYGGGFDIYQSFVGNMSDVHMWDYTLSPCEIRGYMNHQDFPPGNVLNWRTLEFQISGNVKIQPNDCSLNTETMVCRVKKKS